MGYNSSAFHVEREKKRFFGLPRRVWRADTIERSTVRDKQDKLKIVCRVNSDSKNKTINASVSDDGDTIIPVV